jgi:hypothetical protein
MLREEDWQPSWVDEDRAPDFFDSCTLEREENRSSKGHPATPMAMYDPFRIVNGYD